MPMNIIEIIQKYSQFTQLLSSCKKDPMQLLESELKTRNISKEQLQEMIKQAKRIGAFLNIK